MKPKEIDTVELAIRLQRFMLEDGWRPDKETRGLRFFVPPVALGFRGKYTIALPIDPGRTGTAGLIHDAADSLVQIYGFSRLGDLLNRAASLSDLARPARFISRFVDRTTTGGAMPLSALASYVSSMEMGLYRGAKFKLGSDSKEADLAASQFAKECMFLQTAEGSFVAKVEVPPTVLKQADLFGEPAVDSAEVCSSLFSAIQFLNDRVLNGDDEFEESGMLDNIVALFDVELLEALHEVLAGPEMETIELSLEIGNRLRMTSTGWMSPAKRSRLKEFVQFVRDQLRGERDIDVSGSIVELRSRDPEGNRNHIRVVAEFFGDRTFITATLNNEQYQRAVDAHRGKHAVRLVGSGVRLKTSIRMNDLTFFGT